MELLMLVAKALELLLLLSVGLISTLAHPLLSFFSSPPTLIINLIVLLIFASSAFSARRHHIITTTTTTTTTTTLLPPPPPTTTINNLALITTQPHDHEIKTTSPTSSEVKWKDVFIHNQQTPTYDQNEEDNTMEATWKAITGGKEQKPKKKHLRKSETWPDAPATPPRALMHRLDSEEVLPTSPKWKELRKAETFNDAVSVMRRGGLIRRGPSISLEEFNQKVEAFIKNFNNNMRLQRQESHQRYLDKINNQRF